MSDNELGEKAELLQGLVQPTIKLILALGLLFALQFVLSVIPGVDQVVLEPDVTIGTLLYAAITIVMFGAVFNFGQTVGSYLKKGFPSLPDAERTVQLLTLLIITIWAYQEFWWLPHFRSNPGQYDIFFLILGVGLGGWLGYLLYTNVEEYSELATGKVFDVTGVDPASTSGETGTVDSQNFEENDNQETSSQSQSSHANE